MIANEIGLWYNHKRKVVDIMKKLLCILMAAFMAFSLCACGEEEVPEKQGKAFLYEEHGIKLEIPAVWDAATFVPYYNEYEEFSSHELKAVINGDEALVLTIAAFPEEHWAKVTEQNPEEAKKLEIGTSKDGTVHYILRFEETKFEDEESQEKFNTIVKAAKESCKKLEITE